MSFIQRQLQITFTLPPAQVPFRAPSFASAPAGTNANTIILSGLRASAKIVKAGGITGSNLDLTVYGMKRTDMNQLSTLGMEINLVPKSNVQVAASDQNGNFGVVFSGTITQAYFDPSAMPDVGFRVSAQTGILRGSAWIPPTSFKGAVDIITVMQSIATASGFAFHNYGVTPGSVMMNNPYYNGASKQQIQEIAKHYGIYVFFGDQDDLTIMPLNGSTPNSGLLPLVSKSSGLIGYPSFTPGGIMFRTVYNPSIGFRSQIQVQSDLPQASGKFIVNSLDHNLDAMVPNGQWFSEIKAYSPDSPVLLVP